MSAASSQTKRPGSGGALAEPVSSTNLAEGKQMNAHSDTTKTQDPATVAEFAALEFEPWQHKADEWTPPTNEEWERLANPHLITIRIAWLILHKSKAELVDMVAELFDDEGDVGPETFERLHDTAEWLRGLLKLVRGAEARLCAAGAVLELREEAS
jgi:hypothetical protein